MSEDAPFWNSSGDIGGGIYSSHMADDSRPESSDDRPGQSSDDGPAAHPERKTPDRAPTVRIDLSHLEPLAEVGRRIGEQLAETIKIGVRARLDRVTASTALGVEWA